MSDNGVQSGSDIPPVLRNKRKGRRISLYLAPEVPTDRGILDLFAHASKNRRSQDFLRLALVRGVRSMIETGDIPKDQIVKFDLITRFDPRFVGQHAPPPVLDHRHPSTIPPLIYASHPLTPSQSLPPEPPKPTQQSSAPHVFEEITPPIVEKPKELSLSLMGAKRKSL